MSKYMIAKEIIVGGDKCKATFFLRKHKCVNRTGQGFRCKYCGTSLRVLRELERRAGNGNN